MHGFIKLYISAVLLLLVVASDSRQTTPTSSGKDTVTAKTADSFGEGSKATHRSPPLGPTDNAERCSHPFTLFCYYQTITRTSHCECTYIIRPGSSAIVHQEGITKHCNADVSICAYIYETDNRCRKDWKFQCTATHMPGFDWECSCQGRSGEGEERPPGYNGVGRWCWKFWYYKSLFVEKVEPMRNYVEVGRGVGKALIEQDSLS
ncbi:hypothetical protein DFP73DRAFT_377542 [Morchella snyderi]|nr:hypothetical protein DFP73DRAFT_377542 [Morchella snyderi]